MSDKLPQRSGQSGADLVIIGGGIFGLWAARKAAQRGLNVLLLDAGRLGAGTSGGLLGALMAHMPDRWNAKKQLQFDGLVSLPTEVATLEAETGLKAGYRRVGRLIPLPKPHLRPIAERHQAEALTNWHQGEHAFQWSVAESPSVEGWPAGDMCPAGLVYDTLAARVSPRLLTAAIGQSLRHHPRVEIREAAHVVGIVPKDNTIVLVDGSRVGYQKLLVAAGCGSFPLLSALGPALTEPLGRPVKGQAALLRADVPDDLPLLYLDGLYAVPHEGGHVAIGSTSENSFDDPKSTDEKLTDLIEAARRLAPRLQKAEVVERWAGLRPRAVGGDPMVGPHPDAPDVFALTGGFKVSFGIGHLLADAVLDMILGVPVALPDSYLLTHHISVAKGE